MTKYICECTTLGSLHTCTCEADNIPPEMCCVSGCKIEGWQRAEKHKDTSSQKVPDWCRTGAWVYVTPYDREPFYGKIYGVTYSRVNNTVEVRVTLDGKSLIGVFTWDNIWRARLRPWNCEELKSKVGKVFEDEFGNRMLCIKYYKDDAYLYFIVRSMSAADFVNSSWTLDGLPCGVLEHDEQGEWVE